MKISLNAIVWLILFLSSNTFASASFNRMNQLVLQIENEMTVFSQDQTKIDELADGKLRQYLFVLETLSDLYSKKYSDLKDVKTKVKGLEDQVGIYRKSVEQYDYAVDHHQSAKTVENLRIAREFEKSNLVKYLSEQSWIGKAKMIAALKKTLEKQKWDSDLGDKIYTYSSISNLLNDIDKTNWDMTVLEGGKGIHDLRKSVRWYKLQVSALTDMFEIQEKTCEEIADNNLDAQMQKCILPSCLHKRMNEIYETFGDVKDIGEGQEGIGGSLPSDELVKVKNLYEDTRQQEIFKKLKDQINSCSSVKN